MEGREVVCFNTFKDTNVTRNSTHNQLVADMSLNSCQRF